MKKITLFARYRGSNQARIVGSYPTAFDALLAAMRLSEDEEDLALETNEDGTFVDPFGQLAGMEIRS